MDVSINGIEEAIGGLDYRNEESPKSRLVRAIQTYYVASERPESIRSIDGDRLIDIMWQLGGDPKAIRSKRKNLNAIKSSVNKDFDAAWEDGRNPEGVTIGPENNFIMSDAAKDKILNSFSGSMNLDGGGSLDRVAEALKIVSDYLAEMPEGIENEQLANLKSIVEGLSDKIGEGGDKEFEIVEKTVAIPGEETEAVEEVDSDDDIVDSDDDIEEIDTIEGSDEELAEVVEDEMSDEEDEDFELADGGEGEEYPDETDEVEEIEDDAVEVVEDDEFVEEGDLDDTEIVEIVDGEEFDGGEEYFDGQEEAFDSEEGEEDVVELSGAEGLADADEVEVVYEDDMGDGYDDGFEDGEDENDGLEIAGEDDEEVDTEEAFEEIVDGDEEDALEEDADDEEGDEEFIDEEIVEEAADDIEEADAFEEDESDSFEDIEDDDESLEEVEEVEEGGEDVVEIEGVEGLEDVDEVEIMDGEDLVEAEDDDFIEDDLEAMDGEAADDVLDDDEYDVEEIEEAEEDEDDGDEAETGRLENGLGLPIDQLMDSAQNFEEFSLDGEQKRLLAEQFDGYLGAMERFYNQYLLIKKGSYPVGTVNPGFDVLPEQKVLLSDYYMGKYPVTNALFEVFVERTGYKTTAEKLGYGYVYHGRFRKMVDPATGLTRSVWNPTATREKVDGATWYQPLGPGSTLHKKRNHPVVQVSVRDARTFAAWTGKRLPTEIEWEAAARNRDGNIRPWGDEWMEGACNLENSGISDTCPVDAYPLGENETGLADLLGNVLEWTGDECEPKYQLENPGKYFIAKGGAWISSEKTFLYDRSRFEVDFRANILGFRCIAD
jgi:formylglycine-generating enzyme required for sulfatase activity